MFDKVIIENRTTMPLEDALIRVARVIEMGRISNNCTQYCYHTHFSGDVGVAAFKNKCSDRFIVFKDDLEA